MPASASETFNNLVRLLTPLARMANVLHEHPELVPDAFRDVWVKRNPGAWVYLVSRLDGMDGMAVAAKVEVPWRRGTHDYRHAEEVLEKGLTDPDLLDELAEAITRTSLGNAQRRQLLASLHYVREHDYELAVPMLMNPLEGAFWRLAEQRGLARREGPGAKWSLTDERSKDGTLGALEAVIKIKGLEIDDNFKAFMTGLAYGGHGNAFRHGTAEGGWRIRGLCLIVTLIGLLDLYEVLDGDEHLRNAFRRQREDPKARE